MSLAAAHPAQRIYQLRAHLDEANCRTSYAAKCAVNRAICKLLDRVDIKGEYDARDGWTFGGEVRR